MKEGNAVEKTNANLEEEVIDNDPVQPDKNEGADKSGSPDKDKKIDNAEDSRIGRIVKNQVEKAKGELASKYDTEISSLKATIATYEKEKNKVNVDDDDPPPVEGFPTTPEEFVAMKEWADNRKTKKENTLRETYNKSYISSINTLREEGGDLHAQIQELLTKDGSPYNVTHGTGNGKADATINYYRAKADIMANKVKEPTNPFKGRQSDVPIGTSASSRVPASKTTGKVKFDSDKAEDFANYLGLTDEERASAISSKG